MANFDDEFSSPPRRNRKDPITGKLLPSNTKQSIKQSISDASITRSSAIYHKAHKSSKTSESSAQTYSRTSETRSAQDRQAKRAQLNKLIDNITERDNDDDTIQQPTKVSNKPQKTLLMRGIDYLSRREHSAYELRRKLAPYAESEEELEATLARLQKENWQNDERFIRTFTQSKQARWGSAKVLHALQSHKLEPEDLQEVRETLKETEFERALEVYQRKFRTPLHEVDDYQREYAKRVRFMMSRGFNAEIVRKVIKSPIE